MNEEKQLENLINIVKNKDEKEIIEYLNSKGSNRTEYERRLFEIINHNFSFYDTINSLSKLIDYKILIERLINNNSKLTSHYEKCLVKINNCIESLKY